MKKATIIDGQLNLATGAIDGIENLVNKPEILEHDGLRVLSVIIPKNEFNTPGYIDTATEIAKKLAPNIRSSAKPPWLQRDWQIKRRKRKAGIK